MAAAFSNPILPTEIPAKFNVADFFLDDPAKRHRDRVAINGEPHRLTYGGLAALASRVGNGLLELGVSRRGPHANRASGFG